MNSKKIALIALVAISLSCTAQATDKKRTTTDNSTTVERVAKVEPEEVVYFPSTFADSRLNGEWNIANVNGQKVTGEDRPFIGFDLAQRRFYGNNGCNLINGEAITDRNNSLQFGSMISTQRYCADAPFQYIITSTLEQVRSYKVSRYGNEYYLDLFNQRGHLIMVLCKSDIEFLNGAWRVTAINGTPNNNESIRFVIDLPEKKIHGNAGCNIINGEISIDPDVTNSVQFANIASTRMMCPDLSTETAVLVALEETEKVLAKSDDTISFINHAGNTVLQLVRIDPRADGE